MDNTPYDNSKDNSKEYSKEYSKEDYDLDEERE